MLRLTSTAFALAVAASASAQQPAGQPQPGATLKPAQTTKINAADENQSQERNANRSTTAPANGVQPGQPANRGTVTKHAVSNFDSHVADCLILGNQEEVAMLKFGMERAKNNEVKELAASMIKDHEKSISELRQFASHQHANSELTGTSDNSQKNKVTTREARKQVSDTTAVQGSSGSSDSMEEKMHRMAHRAAEQCLILNREELTKYEGERFDQAFLGQQLGAHIGMLAKLKAAGEETSSELSGWTTKAQEATKMHKSHLEKLMNTISEKEHGKK